MGRMPNDDISPGGISARLTPPSADTADPWGINDYDSFAEVYSAENEVNLHNAYYERPATCPWPGTWPAVGSSTWGAARARCPRRCATGAPS